VVDLAAKRVERIRRRSSVHWSPFPSPFDSEEEAIEMANSNAYGLSATIWTENLKRAHRVSATGKEWDHLGELLVCSATFARHSVA